MNAHEQNSIQRAAYDAVSFLAYKHNIRNVTLQVPLADGIGLARRLRFFAAIKANGTLALALRARLGLGTKESGRDLIVYPQSMGATKSWAKHAQRGAKIIAFVPAGTRRRLVRDLERQQVATIDTYAVHSWHATLINKLGQVLALAKAWPAAYRQKRKALLRFADPRDRPARWYALVGEKR